MLTSINEMSAQIKAYYFLSTNLEKLNGEAWYANAYDECSRLADAYYMSVRTVVGIVAALSPRNKWERNISDAERIILCGSDATVSTFKANKEKALRISDGHEPLDVLVGNKVRAFFECIISAYGHTSTVCVDSHSYAVACGYGERVQKRNISDFDYKTISAAYRLAADELGLKSYELQAITWLTYRRIHNVYWGLPSWFPNSLLRSWLYYQ